MIEIKFVATDASKLREDMLSFLNSIPWSEPKASAAVVYEEQMEFDLEEGILPAHAEIQEAPQAIDKKLKTKKPRRKPIADSDIEDDIAESVKAAISKMPEESAAPEEEKTKPLTKDKTASEKTTSGATKDSVQAALQKVNAEVGLAKARDILHAFGINRVSEIKPEFFDKFQAMCEAAIEG